MEEIIYSQKDLQKLHSLELMILKEIDRVCKKNGINYFLAYGTLLGAIRHSGFIPWDDDLDVAMLRKDYDRFISIFQNETDSHIYFLENWDTEESYGLSFSKVKLNGTVFEENSIKKTNTHKGIYVDIFPYDYLPDKDSELKRIASRTTALAMIYKFKKKYLPTNPDDKIQYYFSRIISLVSKAFPENKIRKLLSKYEQAYNTIGGNRITAISSAYRCKDYFPAECIKTTIDWKFEDGCFPIPSGYDVILRCIYGDYMKLPPKEKQVCRHSPGLIDFGSYNEV